MRRCVSGVRYREMERRLPQCLREPSPQPAVNHRKGYRRPALAVHRLNGNAEAVKPEFLALGDIDRRQFGRVRGSLALDAHLEPLRPQRNVLECANELLYRRIVRGKSLARHGERWTPDAAGSAAPASALWRRPQLEEEIGTEPLTHYRGDCRYEP